MANNKFLIRERLRDEFFNDYRPLTDHENEVMSEQEKFEHEIGNSFYYTYKTHEWSFAGNIPVASYLDIHMGKDGLSDEAQKAIKEKIQEIKSICYDNHKWKQKSFRKYVNNYIGERKYTYIWMAEFIIEIGIEYEIIRGSTHKTFLKYLKKYRKDFYWIKHPKAFHAGYKEYRISVKDQKALIKCFQEMQEKGIINIGKESLANFIFLNFDTGLSNSTLIDKFKKFI